MFNLLLWIFPSVLINSYISIYILRKRFFNIDQKKIFIILLIMFISTFWTYTAMKVNCGKYRLSFVLSIIFITSMVDIREKLVFDRDVICGIIVEMVVSTIIEFKDMGPLLWKIFQSRQLNLINVIFGSYMWVSMHISLVNFFSYGIYFNRDIYESFLGMTVLFLFIYIPAKVTKAIGMGDVLYFTFLGMFANFFGCIVIFFSSFMVCSLYSMVLRIMNKDFEDGLISFIPFISIGLIIFCCIAK